MRANKPAAETSWVAWLPMAVLPLSAIAVRASVPPWGFMWLLAFSIFAALKWLTWWQGRGVSQEHWRSAAYLLAWPGMDAESFLDARRRMPRPPVMRWVWALFEIVLGASLLWGIARRIPVAAELLRGWAGMLGIVLLLHFGSFQLLCLFWQSSGVDAKPIMLAPIRSASLSEFWGKRWNMGFRQLAHDLVFRPLHRTLGVHATGFFVFVVSGLIHDLVISLPAGAGYGLPMMYFMVQGAGVMVERSKVGQRLGLRQGARGWLFMAIFTAGPAFWLFHPPFIRRVILPFMQAIHAL